MSLPAVSAKPLSDNDSPPPSGLQLPSTASWSELPEKPGVAAAIEQEGKNALFVFALPAGVIAAPADAAAASVLLVTSSDQRDGIAAEAVPGGSPTASLIWRRQESPSAPRPSGARPRSSTPAPNAFQFASASAAFVSGCAALVEERNSALIALNCGQAVSKARP